MPVIPRIDPAEVTTRLHAATVETPEDAEAWLAWGIWCEGEMHNPQTAETAYQNATELSGPQAVLDQARSRLERLRWWLPEPEGELRLTLEQQMDDAARNAGESLPTPSPWDYALTGTPMNLRQRLSLMSITWVDETNENDGQVRRGITLRLRDLETGERLELSSIAVGLEPPLTWYQDRMAGGYLLRIGSFQQVRTSDSNAETIRINAFRPRRE